MVLNIPRPVELPDGAMLFAARIAIREGRPYKKRVTKRGQRLTWRWVSCQLYTVKRYEFAVFYWFDLTQPPDMIGQFASKDEAAEELERQLCQLS